MKTGKQIKDAIELKRKVEWAISLIDETSEKMFRDLKLSCELQVLPNQKEDFEAAWDQYEVVKCLKDNGFVISRHGAVFILKVKE